MSKKEIPQTREQKIPDLIVVDLDKETLEDVQKTAGNASDDLEQAFPDSGEPPVSPVRKILSHINIHIVLAAVVVIVILFTVNKFTNWGEYVDPDALAQEDPGEYVDSLDSFLPLTDERGVPIPAKEDDGETVIVAFGNAPFADDRGSKDNLASLIAEMADATVYNCSVSGSYLASLPYENYALEQPVNLFNFYWLCHLSIGDALDGNYHDAIAILGEDAPPEAEEVFTLIKSIDFDKVDVIAIMYDGSDYLAGHPMYNDANSQDITQFTGNLMAGIQMLRETFPHIRIIVMSPPYAYSDKIDEETGKYMSSDIVRYGHDVLSTYVIKQREYCVNIGITFVDNLYGTVTGANADQYLTDNLHLNVAGRKKIAGRFVEALRFFDE